MTTPQPVLDFLDSNCIAVAGVSHDHTQPANAIYRKLKASGYKVVPVNPGATELEGDRCYPDLRSIPAGVEAVMLVTHPQVAASVVRECGELGIHRVWFHRSFGCGSVSDEAIHECERLGIYCLVGGCPMMYCEPDFGHKCMRWILKFQHRLPA